MRRYRAKDKPRVVGEGGMHQFRSRSYTDTGVSDTYPRHSISEKRWAAFGKTDANRFLIVVFTKRGDLIRVISARDMNKKEREFYDEKE